MNPSRVPSALPPACIAVVEDEDELRELIVGDLASRGHTVAGFPSAEALYRHMSVHGIDIVVLDIGLPGENGFDVAAHLRQLASVGIIMLTARAGSRSMMRGLSEGADLYLLKPVDYDVLSVAVTNLHRRLASPAPVAAPTSAGWTIADGGWTLRGPGEATLALSDQERAVISVLFGTAGEPVRRATLIEALTDQPQHFDPHRLDALVHRLRNRVLSVFGRPLPLRSVRGTGYVLTP